MRHGGWTERRFSRRQHQIPLFILLADRRLSIHLGPALSRLAYSTLRLRFRKGQLSRSESILTRRSANTAFSDHFRIRILVACRPRDDDASSNHPDPRNESNRALMPRTNPIGSRPRSQRGSVPTRTDHARYDKRAIHLTRARHGTTRVSSAERATHQIPARAVSELFPLVRNLCRIRTRARKPCPSSQLPLAVLWVRHHILGVRIPFPVRFSSL